MKERINYLLSKFEEGGLSKVETAELLELTNSSEPELADAIVEMIHLQVPDTVIENADWGTVLNRIVAVDKQQAKTWSLFPVMRWLSAAVILITLGVGSWFYFKEETPLPADNIKYANDIPPGSNDAILTLADGSKISLTEADKGELLDVTGVRIVKTADGQLVYTIVQNELLKETKPAFNTVSTPRGGQYQVNLPDGTKVWLNAASSLKFPTTFTNLKERKVELSGEAYFEVAKNKQQPFKVLSSAGQDRIQEIEVLGTHFNINAYDDETETKTTLLEGSVKAAAIEKADRKSDVILIPGQQAILSKLTFRTLNVDTEEAIAWKNGNFVFANEGIESIMRKIARWYNVEVNYQGKITDNTFVGRVPRFANISEALTILELTNTVHFKIEGRRITVMP